MPSRSRPDTPGPGLCELSVWYVSLGPWGSGTEAGTRPGALLGAMLGAMLGAEPLQRPCHALAVRGLLGPDGACEGSDRHLFHPQRLTGRGVSKCGTERFSGSCTESVSLERVEEETVPPPVSTQRLAWEQSRTILNTAPWVPVSEGIPLKCVVTSLRGC